jgi:hypothetical protein
MRTIWLASIAIALAAGSSVCAQESMMQRMMSRPAKGGADGWDVRHDPSPGVEGTVEVEGEVIYPPVDSFLPKAPVVVPPAKRTQETPARKPVLVPATNSSQQTPALKPILVPATNFSQETPVLKRVATGTKVSPATNSDPIIPAAPPPEAAKLVPADAVIPALPPHATCDAGHGAGCKLHDHLACLCSGCDKLKSWFAYRQLHGCCGHCVVDHTPPLYLWTVDQCVEGHHDPALPCCARQMGPFRGILVGEVPVHASSVPPDGKWQGQ